MALAIALQSLHIPFACAYVKEGRHVRMCGLLLCHCSCRGFILVHSAKYTLLLYLRIQAGLHAKATARLFTHVLSRSHFCVFSLAYMSQTLRQRRDGGHHCGCAGLLPSPGVDDGPYSGVIL